MTARSVVRRMFDTTSPMDVAVAAVVVVIGQQEAWAPVGGAGWSHRVGPHLAAAAAFFVCAVTLLWRRKAPIVVVAVVTAALSADYLAFGASDGLACLLAPALAFYAAGRYGRARSFGVAGLMTAAGLAVHEWRDPQFTFAGPTAVFWAVLVGSGLLGRVLNVRATDLQTMSWRARQLEEQSDEHARAAARAERARIARDLHDLVGHGISLMVLQLVAAQGNLDNGQIEPARQRLARLEGTARTTLAEMRRLVTVTDDEATLSPQPGIDDVRVLVSDIRTSGVPIELEIIGPIEAPPGLGLAVYRVVQEALTNVMRHADPAAGARVTITGCGDIVTVEVTDGGTRVQGDVRYGRGISGMRERVALYGGSLEVGPTQGGGFHVCARFPLEAALA